MARWLVVAAGAVIIALGVSAGTALRLATERDAARAAAVELRQRLDRISVTLDISDTLLARYRRLTSRGNETIDALHTQVDWDKSHLLDCWTVIVRTVDPSRLRDIFGSWPAYLVRAARDGATVAHFTRRCASDAVP
jgi:hypothetical protein